MSVNRAGLTPVRTLDGTNNFTTARFQKSTGSNDASLIYVGDAVRVTANGQVKKIITGQTDVLGVVARVVRNEAGRPRVHGLPDQHPNISLTADADYLDVYVNPLIVYSGRIAGSAGRSMIGQTMAVTTTARVTAAGLSGMILDATSSASSLNPFRVIGVSDFNTSTRLGDSGGRVDVVVQNHQAFGVGQASD